MPINILFVTDNQEEFIALDEELASTGGDGSENLSLQSVPSERSAKNALSDGAGAFKLVIAPLRIREKPSSPVDKNEQRGLDLLKYVLTNQMGIPTLLIAPTYPDGLSDGIHFVPSGGGMIQEVAKQARRLVQRTPSRLLEVEIVVTDETHWNVKLRGCGFPYESDDVLVLDARTMADVTDYSKDLSLPGYERWKEKLRMTGDSLFGALQKNPAIYASLVKGLIEAGGEENSRVRFLVSSGVHDLALEALLCPQAIDLYWMLQAPVYRRLRSQQPSASGTLFEGGQRIETLIIEAPASGLAQNPDVLLPELTAISAECRNLQDSLKKNQANFNVADPVYVGPIPGQPMAKRVQELLESREWGIVHYAGHSHFDASKKTGYVFFPGESKGAIEAVDITKFSGWLRKAKFVYLSSCRSGAGQFMFELASRRVSNLVGFRWPINDDLASQFASLFYENLFSTRSFEQAYLKGRKKMHSDHPDDRIWAAPLLIMQLNES
jgi:hypothetical protein